MNSVDTSDFSKFPKNFVRVVVEVSASSERFALVKVGPGEKMEKIAFIPVDQMDKAVRMAREYIDGHKDYEWKDQYSVAKHDLWPPHTAWHSQKKGCFLYFVVDSGETKLDLHSVCRAVNTEPNHYIVFLSARASATPQEPEPVEHADLNASLKRLMHGQKKQ